MQEQTYVHNPRSNGAAICKQYQNKDKRGYDSRTSERYQSHIPLAELLLNKRREQHAGNECYTQDRGHRSDDACGVIFNHIGGYVERATEQRNSTESKHIGQVDEPEVLILKALLDTGKESDLLLDLLLDHEALFTSEEHQ